jgi:hypothetical protein
MRHPRRRRRRNPEKGFWVGFVVGFLGPPVVVLVGGLVMVAIAASKASSKLPPAPTTTAGVTLGRLMRPPYPPKHMRARFTGTAARAW